MRSILFIRASYRELIGGIEEIILMIATQLAEKKIFSPILATSDIESIFSKRFRELGFPVYEVPIRGKRSIKRGEEAIERILKEHNVAIIQSEMFRESIIARKVRNRHTNIRHVYRVHTHIEGSNIPSWKRYAYHVLDHWTSKDVDLFVPISNVVKNELVTKSKILPEHIHVVYCGIPSLGLPDPPNNSDSSLTPSIVLIGELQERKQQLLAVEVVGKLYSKHIKIDLHLIGGDRENCMNKIQDIAKRKGIEHLIHLYGYQPHDKIYKIIKDIPIVILPSLFEGIPISLLEGMALRKLVIGTPVGGTSEAIQDGVNGLLHPPQDIEALANILERVFTTPAKIWEPIRDAGYKTWQEKFSINQMMNGLIRVYNELLN